MKVIIVYNHKGGCSKTVTAINFAYYLSEAGYQVLVADMDPQGNASSFFGRYDMNKSSVRELLTGEKAPGRCCYRTRYLGIDILPANLRLREVAPGILSGGRNALKQGLAAMAEEYDYCIVDCPPSVDFLTEVILAAAEDIIVPLKPDRFSADGLGTVLDIIRDFCDDDVAVKGLFTQFYRHRDSLSAIHDMMATSCVSVYDSVIRRCSAVDHSILVRRPLAKCASKSTAAQDYRDFAMEYLNISEEVERNGIA